MTAILAIDGFYQIMVVADCRVTWLTTPPKLQDNLQKVYPLGPTGVIGFAGGVAAAKAIFNDVRKETSSRSLPSTARDIVNDIAAWARTRYSQLSQRDKIDLELMYVASDYGRVTLVTSNVTFAKNILVKFVSPNFEPAFQTDFVALGYAKQYPADVIRKNMEGMLSLGLDPVGQKMLIGSSIGVYGEGLAKIAGDPVGGLFCIGIVSARGVGWSSYSIGDQVKLEIENGTFVQYDLKDGRRIPLKTIWDFDARRPDAGNLAFKTRPSL